jgi:arsenate reductase (thioredoxin)
MAATHRPLQVLVLCTGNSARSILGEALLNHLGRGAVRGFSAGSRPVGRVNPLALRVLAENGIATDALRSKSWDEFGRADSPAMDLVVTVCDSAAGESCPWMPGAPLRAHWGLPDPAAVQGSEERRLKAFRDTYAELNGRIARLVDGLGRQPAREQLAAALERIAAGA